MGRADEAQIKRQIAAAVAAYVGPVTKCPPGMARAEEPVKLILRPRYRFGRGNSSVKVKNPAPPAVKREAEEDWN